MFERSDKLSLDLLNENCSVQSQINYNPRDGIIVENILHKKLAARS